MRVLHIYSYSCINCLLIYLTIQVSVLCTPYPAMHREYKVIRLEWEAIHVNYSYLLEHLAPDELLPQLTTRRLLTPEKMKQVKNMSSRQKQITTILNALRGFMVVGMLPTLCAALSSIPSQEHITEQLRQCENFIQYYKGGYLLSLDSNMSYITQN